MPDLTSLFLPPRRPEEEDRPDEREGTHGAAGAGAAAGGGTGPRPPLSRRALKQRYVDAAGEGMAGYAALMYAHEGGVAPFYAGVVTSALQSCTEKALYFFAYTFCKNG